MHRVTATSSACGYNTHEHTPTCTSLDFLTQSISWCCCCSFSHFRDILSIIAVFNGDVQQSIFHLRTESASNFVLVFFRPGHNQTLTLQRCFLLVCVFRPPVNCCTRHSGKWNGYARQSPVGEWESVLRKGWGLRCFFNRFLLGKGVMKRMEMEGWGLRIENYVPLLILCSTMNVSNWGIVLEDAFSRGTDNLINTRQPMHGFRLMSRVSHNKG
jgi:hypothetical protein